METLNKYLNICIPYSVWSCYKYALPGNCNVELIADVDTIIRRLIKWVHPISVDDIKHVIYSST
jgi:hypothetical protein